MSKNTNDNLRAVTKREHLLLRMPLTFGAETGNSDYQFSSQKTVAIREGIDNAVDAINKNKIKNGRIKVIFHKDHSVTIKDNGGGIPVGPNKTAEGEPASSLYIALGVINSSSNYDQSADRFSLGTNGVGFSSAVALSEFADITSYREKKAHTLRFRNGEAVEIDKKGNITPLKDLTKLEVTKDTRSAEEKKLYPTGTVIHIKLEDKNFKSKYGINYNDLIDRMKDTAILSKGLTIEIVNEHKQFDDGSYQEELYDLDGGVVDLIKINTRTYIGDILSFSGEGTFIDISADGNDFEKKFEYNVAVAYEDSFEDNILSYVNTIKTRIGGVHVEALKKAWREQLTLKLQSMRGMLTKSDPEPTENDILEGLTAVISIRVSDPDFEGQIKQQLGGAALKKELYKSLSKDFEKIVNAGKNIEAIKAIGEKIVAATKSRQKLLDEKLAKRKSNKVASGSLPEKLADCEITGEEESELFICEGDSAAGTIKKSRNSMFQAVIPVRGKVLNTWKSDTKKILNNKEIIDIATALGAGLGSSFDINKIRYGKILIATDQDQDGLEISNLITTLFYQLFRPMIEEGRVYKAQSPLFEVIPISGADRTPIYAFSDAEKNEIIKRLDSKNIKYKLERAKGLGELDAETFYETAMNPETRKVIRILPTDVEKMEEALELIMGANSEERIQFMNDNYQVAVDSGMVDV